MELLLGLVLFVLLWIQGTLVHLCIVVSGLCPSWVVLLDFRL